MGSSHICQPPRHLFSLTFWFELSPGGWDRSPTSTTSAPDAIESPNWSPKGAKKMSKIIPNSP